MTRAATDFSVVPRPGMRESALAGGLWPRGPSRIPGGPLAHPVSGRKADTIFQSLAFSRLKVTPRSLQACPPVLYEAHRRNIASI